jgi:GlpG protein
VVAAILAALPRKRSYGYAMRMIGQVENEASASVFSDYLYAQGIDNQIEPDRSGAWLLWVHDEEQLGRASALLNQFRGNPADPKYREASGIARERRELEASKNSAVEKRLYDRRKLFPAMSYGVGVLTAVLIAISVAVGVFSKGAFSELKIDRRIILPLSITEYEIAGNTLQWQGGLPEIRNGQVWRLVTPIFIHFGPVHLILNMLCLLDLGTMIERRKSGRLLLALVLFIAATSNLAQYIFGNAPNFGGMSGVVYGLIGYIWMKGRFDIASGLFLHRSTVTMAMIWFFGCLAGVIPGIANTAHAVGLGVGIAWGFLSAQGWKQIMRG